MYVQIRPNLARGVQEADFTQLRYENKDATFIHSLCTIHMQGAREGR